jgi:hypothetical protein
LELLVTLAPSNPDELCNCEEQTSITNDLITPYAAAAATTVKSLGMQLIIVVTPNAIHSEINADNWKWLTRLCRWNVRIETARPCGISDTHS